MTTARKQARRRTPGSDAPRSASKRKASKGHGPRRKGSPPPLSIAHPDAAGIDVGARVHYVAVPQGRAEPPVRSFGAYTAQLDELVRWLQSCGITTVAMESTGSQPTGPAHRSTHGRSSHVQRRALTSRSRLVRRRHSDEPLRARRRSAPKYRSQSG
jgi:hypothetical protein